MSNPYIGQIALFAFNFAPQSWHLCDGSLLPINQYQALYALLGTTYGGNGSSTFGIPDLRSRRPVGMGSGPGLPTYNLGQMGGAETQSLTQSNLPAHTHGTTFQVVPEGRGGTPAPAQAGYLLSSDANAYVPSGGGASTALGTGNITVQPTGGSTPFSVVEPYTTLNFCIALVGIFPSRP